MAIVTNHYVPQSGGFCSFFSCDCISEETAIKIGKVALGVLAFIVATPLVEFAIGGVKDLLASYGCDMSPSQDAIQIWNEFGELPAIFAIPLQTVLCVYIVALGPILEEVIFRDMLRDFLAHACVDRDTFWGKVEMVLLNGLAFGAAHLSPAQGWTNVIMFLFTFLLGCVLAILREVTGDIIAPSAMHIANNGTYMVQFLFFT